MGARTVSYYDVTIPGAPVAPFRIKAESEERVRAILRVLKGEQAAKAAIVTPVEKAAA